MPGVSKSQRAVYRKVGKRSMCRGKRYQNPNRCSGKSKSCKISRGTQRTYCRKKKAKRYSKRNPDPNVTYGYH